MTWIRGTVGDPPLDPPDDETPVIECPDCEGEGFIVGEDKGPGIDCREMCEACEGNGERHMTAEEVAEERAEAMIERAERRRDETTDPELIGY